MPRRPVLIPLVTLLVALAPTAGQEMVGSGQALDSNLRIGSGGYNSPVGAGYNRLERQMYRPGMASLDRYNAFQMERMYTPTRSPSYYRSRSPYGSPYRPTTFGSAGGPAPPARPSASWTGGGYQGRVDPGYEPNVGMAGKPGAPGPAGVPAPAPPMNPTTAHQAEVLAYGLGYALGQEIRAGIERDGLDLDDDSLVSGFGDGVHGSRPQIARDVLEQILREVHARVEQRVVSRLLKDNPAFRKRHDENLERSRKFHDEFGREEGVVTLPSGVQYKVLGTGTGPRPEPTDRVLVSYSLLDLEGNPKGEPETAVIDIRTGVEGVAQILQMMKVGSRWLVAIPPERGFGEAGEPPLVGPDETILAEVNLIEIKSE